MFYFTKLTRDYFGSILDIIADRIQLTLQAIENIETDCVND